MQVGFGFHINPGTIDHVSDDGITILTITDEVVPTVPIGTHLPEFGVVVTECGFQHLGMFCDQTTLVCVPYESIHMQAFNGQLLARAKQLHLDDRRFVDMDATACRECRFKTEVDMCSKCMDFLLGYC